MIPSPKVYPKVAGDGRVCLLNFSIADVQTTLGPPPGRICVLNCATWEATPGAKKR